MIDLDAIRKRCELATAGPWHITGANKHFIAQDNGDPCDYFTLLFEAFRHWEPSRAELNRANMEFVISARQDIPELIAEVERLRAEKEIFQELLRQ